MTDGHAKLEEEEEKELEEWVIWKMFQEGKLLNFNFNNLNFVLISFLFYVFYWMMINGFNFQNFRFRNGFRTIKTKRAYLGLDKSKSG